MDGTPPPGEGSNALSRDRQNTIGLDAVIGANVKRLRNRLGITASVLAHHLSLVLDRTYTRYTVADIEGRRERQVRWSELVALAYILNVPLWDLVLPDGDERVDAPIPDRVVGGDTPDWTYEEPYPELALMQLSTEGTVIFEEEPPGRQELAVLLFGIGDEHLESQALAQLRRDAQENEEKRVQRIAEKVIEELRKES